MDSADSEGDIGDAMASGVPSDLLNALREEIERLKLENAKTKEALSILGNDVTSSQSSQPTPSASAQAAQVVYYSRERKMKKFSGRRGTEEEKVEDFVENVRRYISVRKMNPLEGTDFISSLLESPAKDEVRLRPQSDRNSPEKLCDILIEAFGERRTTPQLLRNFYERRQKDGETLREFLHSLCEIYDRISTRNGLQQETRDLAIRDQLADSVKDSLLRKELRKMIRTNPSCSFLEVREEALRWAEEEEKPVPSKKNVSHQEQAASSDDMVKILQALDQQRQSISSLTEALTTLAHRNDYKQRYGGRRNYDPSKIVCFKCQGVGHKARQCGKSNQSLQQTSNSQASNEHPPSS